MITGIIYLIGFLLTLTFFKHFGTKIGFNYDRDENELHGWDDWDSNAQAFTSFSLMWPVIVPMLLILGIFKMIFKFGKWFLKK
jgi:hypothetical protein